METKVAAAEARADQVVQFGAVAAQNSRGSVIAFPVVGFRDILVPDQTSVRAAVEDLEEQSSAGFRAAALAVVKDKRRREVVLVGGSSDSTAGVVDQIHYVADRQ